jgi:hypothetical protein
MRKNNTYYREAILKSRMTRCVNGLQEENLPLGRRGDEALSMEYKTSEEAEGPSGGWRAGEQSLCASAGETPTESSEELFF